MTTILRSRLGLIALAAAWLGVLAVPAPLANAQQTATPQPVILADFNHDGIPDALVISTTSPIATIAFGSVPYGTFSAQAKAISFPGCSSLPQGSVLVGDFNNDGLPDILFLCEDGSGVMLGNGDGTFAAPQTLPNISTSPAVLGDFNKDGKLDLVVLNTFAANGNGSQQTLQFFAGNGDGTFAASSVNSTLAQQGYTTMIATDINGDGYPDIALGSFNTDSDTATSVSVFGNNKQGIFGVGGQDVYSPNASANVAITAASAILAGNFFGNDVNDLIVPDTGSSSGFFLIQNNSTSGNFSLGTPAKTAVGGLTAALPGFFSGSGATDLVIANGTSISVMDNDGSGNFATDYTTLTIASTSSLFAVADANGDGYSDIYTATSTNGALQLATNVTTGSATATALPVSLGIGTKAVSATWNGNDNLLASTASGQQVVNGAVTGASLTSSKNPSTAGDAVTFTVVVAPSVPTDSIPTGAIVLMDGTNMLASGTLSNGGYSYTTSTLSAATHSIVATYAGDNYFAATSSSALSQVVNRAAAVASNITWATPAPIVYGTALSSTQLDATATTTTGTPIPGTFVYTPAAGTVPSAGVDTLSVTFTPTDPLSFLAATQTVMLTVTSPAVAATITAPPTTPPGSQATVTVTLTQAYPVALVGTLAIGFTRSTTPQITDPALQFAEGGTTLSFPIPANTTTVPPVQLQAGTIAGTITVPLTLTAADVNVTPANLAPVTIEVPPAAPTISGMTITRSGDQLTVVIHGFSNTREVVSAAFHFTAATGATLGTTDLTLPADAIFNTDWFDTDPSDAYGSTFTYTQIFNTSDGAANIGSVNATLTNTIGASATATAQ